MVKPRPRYRRAAKAVAEEKRILREAAERAPEPTPEEWASILADEYEARELYAQFLREML